VSRQPIIAGNIKMFLTIEAALELFREVWAGLSGNEAARVLYFPPFTCLADGARLLAQSPIRVGGQNMHWEGEGAFTGEISPRMLRDAGATHVLIGHSERRTLFGETDETVRKKVESALVHGLQPIVCIGETLEERESGRMEAVLERQVREGLRGLDRSTLTREVTIAYEPVWAIGTGRNATPEQAQEAHRFIRGQLSGIAGEGAESMRILYGGSVKADNASSLLLGPDVDGALVGGACLKPESFLSIIRAAGE
jgi:triosephosphate isomerase